MHLNGLCAQGDYIPGSSSSYTDVEVAVEKKRATSQGIRWTEILDIRVFSVILLLVASVVSARPVSDHELAVCRGLDEVVYQTVTAEPLKDRVVMTRTKGASMPPPTADKTQPEKRSPQGTARLLFLEHPDFMKDGPYQTKVVVVGNEARPLGFTIEFRDHGNNPVHIEWLNEELLFVRVWWGRVVSTDFVLNVETAEPVYLEEANYLGIIAPCDQKRREFNQRRLN